MNVQSYNINLRVGIGITQNVKISQGDVGRELVFFLYDGAVRFSPPSGATVKIKGIKPSGLGFNETCTLSGSVARVFTTLAMTQEGGNIPAELEITNGSVVIGSANFTMYVEPSPHPAGTTDGTTEEARTVLAQCEVYAQAAQEAAEAASGDYTQLSDEIGTLSELTTTAKSSVVAAINEVNSGLSDANADLEDLDERVTALEEGGDGLTDAVKTALMNLVNHVTWDDDDPTGQTYITALYNALYPPADLVSISAVYTQSGAIYETNELDDLKEDLVVTALMSDQTTQTITDYTLSGTLTEETSTITVTYEGKTTTFTVTVSHEAVYTRQVTEAGTFIKSGVYASAYDGTPASIAEDVYSISNVRTGDVIQLATNWNSSNVVGKESRWISTSSKVAPDITAGTFTKVGTSYGLYPVTINQDYEILYIGIVNTSSGGYKQYCTWTRESGF